MVFPVGLIMTVLTGADLYTSYCMYSVVAFLHRRCSFLDILKTWFVSFFGNLAGALFFMAVLTGCMFTSPHWNLKDDSNTKQMAALSKVARTKMKLWPLQRPNASPPSGIRSSSKASSVRLIFLSQHNLSIVRPLANTFPQQATGLSAWPSSSQSPPAK
jgi:hypothetical protein